MSDGNRRKGRSRRPCCLWMVVLALLLASTLAGAFAWFYNHPISNKTIHERVLRRLERISGLHVAYDSAALTLSTGRYRIRNLRFSDPAKPQEPVLEVGEVLARIHPWQLISNPESVITEVVLKDPSQLDLVYTVDSIRLGDRTQFLVDAVRNAQPPGSDNNGQLPFDELKIENAEIAFTEAEGILPELRQAEAAVVMRGDITVANEGEAALDFRFSGLASQPSASDNSATTPTMASGVEASLILDSASSIRFKGEMDRIALKKMFREMPETAMQANSLAFDLTSDVNGELRILKGNLKADSFAFVSPENAVTIHDENLDLQTDLEISTSESLANIRYLAVNSAGASAATSGTIRYGDQPGYDIALSAERIAKDYRILLERLLPHGWDVEARQRDSLAVNLAITGGRTISSLNGSVAMRGISLRMPTLPAPLRNLNGDLIFANDSIRMMDITAEYAGARVALEGGLIGDIWNSRTGEMAFNWSTVIPLEQVLKLHGNQIVSTERPLSGSGVIRGNGTWQQNVNLNNPAESGVPGVEGQIEFENVSLQYPLLPAPVAGLSGRTKIADNRLEVSNLSGKMQGSEITVDGFIEGDRYFWREPEVSASLTSRLDLAQLGPYLSSQQQITLQKYELTGTAQTQMLMNGPLSQVGSRLTGIVQLDGVSFNPSLEFMRGAFSDVSGTVTWDGAVLHLDDLAGKLNNETVYLAGDISAENINLRVDSSPSLETVEQTFPYLDKYLDMSGGSDIDLRFIAGGDNAPQPAPLSQVLESAGALAERSVSEKTFALNGNITFKDGNIRHIAMPLRREENGRRIPEARVTKMNGTLTVNNDTLTAPDNKTISCSFADTPDCRMSGEIKIRPGHYPAMNIKISSAGLLRLDTWATGWGKGLDKPPQPPMTNSKCDIVAKIIAPAVTFRGQQAGSSQGTVIFKMIQNDTPRVTEFQDVVIRGNQPGLGRIIGNGRIESFVWNERQFPKWHTAMDVQAMPLESLLTAVFVQPSNMRGMVSGNIEVQGIGKDARSVRGRGSSFMRNLEIGRTAVIQQLGQTTGRNFGGMLFETAQAATFEIGNGALSSRDLALQTNGLMLEMRGDYYFAGDPTRGIAPRTIDGNLRLRLFKSVLGNIPLIGTLADLADEVTNAVLLAFRVSGTAAAPRVQPIALPMFQGGA